MSNRKTVYLVVIVVVKKQKIKFIFFSFKLKSSKINLVCMYVVLLLFNLIYNKILWLAYMYVIHGGKHIFIYTCMYLTKHCMVLFLCMIHDCYWIFIEKEIVKYLLAFGKGSYILCVYHAHHNIDCYDYFVHG